MAITATGPSSRTGTGVEELLDILEASRPPWHLDAACQEHPEIDWFPDAGQPALDAKRVCAGCLVRQECLAYARTLAARGPVAGVWGGTSFGARLRVKPAAACANCHARIGTRATRCARCAGYLRAHGVERPVVVAKTDGAV